MKTIIYYYSLDGNTDFVAQALKQNLDAQLVRLYVENDKVKPNSLSKYLWGGKAVFMKETPELKQYPIISDADLYIIGSPVWSWSYTPAIRSFLNNFDLTNKNVALFMCHGGGPRKALEHFKKDVNKKGSKIISVIDFKEPLKNKEESLTKISKWCDELKNYFNT